MSLYYFAIRKSAAGTERLGGMDLADDGEAFAFGKGVIRDLVHKDRRHYAGWTMNITHDDGTSVAVLFDDVDSEK
jgi:hypothetical protein